MPKEEVLSKLLKIQGVLIGLPDEKSIFRFVSDSLCEVPGVERVEYHEKKIAPSSSPNYIQYKLQHQESTFGYLRVYINSKSKYVDYETHINDFIYILALVLEERLQRRVIKVNQDEQEELIARRTHEVSIYRDSLDDARRRFSEMIENVSLFSVVLDCRGNVTYCNKFLLNCTGYKINEVVGENWFDTFIPKNDREVVKNVFSCVMMGEDFTKHFENTILAKNNEEIIVSWFNSVLLNRKKNIVGIAAIGENITEKKHADEELLKANEQITELNNVLIAEKEKLEQSELKFRTLYKNTPVMLQSANMQGEIVSVNDTWLEKTGYTYDEVLGTKSSSYLTPESRELYQSLINDFIAKGTLENIEAQAVTKDGRVIDLLISSKILYDKDCKPNLTMTNLLDITEKKDLDKKQKLLNDQLRLAKERAEEGNSIKTAFLQNLSHEIRTPLNAICGFSQLFFKQHANNPKQKKYYDIIINSSNQLLSIVSNILTISSLETKQEVLKTDRFDLNDALKGLYTIYTNQIGNNPLKMKTSFYLPDDNSVIYTDGTKLTQILTNLLNNAIKFTKKGNIELGYTGKGNMLEFYVFDEGIGISSDRMSAIFERFRQANDSVTRDYGGTGLGLSISKAFVELMGGEIRVESELGKGSKFYFTIPFKQETDS